MEAEMRTPGLVHDECRTCIVRDLGQCTYVGHRTEVAGCDDVYGGGSRVRSQRVAESIGRDPMGNTKF